MIVAEVRRKMLGVVSMGVTANRRRSKLWCWENGVGVDHTRKSKKPTTPLCVTVPFSNLTFRAGGWYLPYNFGGAGEGYTYIPMCLCIN